MNRRTLAPRLPHPSEWLALSETESRHIIKVLRLGDGASLLVMDGKGGLAECVLKIREGLAFVQLSEKIAVDQDDVWNIHLAMAITKGDSMEWVLEKCVELGVKTVTPLLSQRSVVRIRDDESKFLSRWRKIADQALKQCGRTHALEIHSPVTIENWQSQTSPAFFLDETCTEPLLAQSLEIVSPTRETLLICGPEGGWEDAERLLLANMATRVSLGKSILRAETAALFSVSTVIAKLQTVALDKRS